MISGIFRRFGAIAYDASVGLFKEYKKTTTELAKIELASYYVRAIKVVRQECMISTMSIFGVIIYANALGVIQVAILLYAPWTIPFRILAALAFGIIASAIPLFISLRLFSEERWLRVTKADEFIAKAMAAAGGAPPAD
jgi:hypothetical protein